MRILKVTPTYFPTISGNTVDVERITTGLKRRCDVKIVTPKDVRFSEIKNFNPDIVHSYHAFKSSIGMQLSKDLGIPLILTLTGTDFNIDIDDDDRKETVLEMIEHASEIVVLNKDIMENISQRLPEISNKLSVIERGRPVFGNSPYDFRSENSITKDDFVFTLIAGIRKVKRNIFPIASIRKLHEKYKNVRLVFVGPVLDNDYFEKFSEAIKDDDWAHYAGVVPRDKIWKVYSESDVILNCSYSEGESNVVFEAMYYGKPLLVSEIAGNICMVDNGNSGICYNNQEDFFNQAKELFENRQLLEKLGANAKKEFERIVNKDEAGDYLRLYQKTLNTSFS